MKPTTELDFEFSGIPAGREIFRTWEVAKIIGHTRKHVEGLIEAGRFGKCLNAGAGDKKSWAVPRAGLLKFIRDNSQ